MFQFLYSSTALLSIFFVKVGEMTLGSDASFSFSPPPAAATKLFHGVGGGGGGIRAAPPSPSSLKERGGGSGINEWGKFPNERPPTNQLTRIPPYPEKKKKKKTEFGRLPSFPQFSWAKKQKKSCTGLSFFSYM